MNERIREIAEQAGCKVMDDGEWYIPSATGFEKIVYTNGMGLEKFAELIIRECLGIVNRHEYSYHEADPLWETAQLIKEHFGVEE